MFGCEEKILYNVRIVQCPQFIQRRIWAIWKRLLVEKLKQNIAM